MTNFTPKKLIFAAIESHSIRVKIVMAPAVLLLNRLPYSPRILFAECLTYDVQTDVSEMSMFEGIYDDGYTPFSPGYSSRDGQHFMIINNRTRLVSNRENSLTLMYPNVLYSYFKYLYDQQLC